MGSLFKVGGYQVFTYNLLDHLTKNGHETYLVVPEYELNENRSKYKLLPYEVLGIKWSKGKSVRYFPALTRHGIRKIQDRLNADIWQVVGAFPAGYLALTLSGRVPIVLRSHGEDVQIDRSIGYGLRLDSNVGQRVEKTLCGVNSVVALTKTMAASYVDMGVNVADIEVIANGVDCQRFFVPSQKGEVNLGSNHTNDTSQSIRLLTVGRYHRKKGFNLIPQIANLLKRAQLDFHWSVVGSGNDVLKDEISRRELNSKVKVFDEIGISVDGKFPSDELVEIYKASDIFVFPSLLEGFPRVIVEAMSASLAVVTTDAEGCIDVITDMETGLITPKHDVVSMANAIGLLIKDSTLRHKMATCGREESLKYDWAKVVNEYESIYKNLLLEG